MSCTPLLIPKLIELKYVYTNDTTIGPSMSLVVNLNTFNYKLLKSIALYYLQLQLPVIFKQEI